MKPSAVNDCKAVSPGLLTKWKQRILKYELTINTVNDQIHPISDRKLFQNLIFSSLIKDFKDAKCEIQERFVHRFDSLNPIIGKLTISMQQECRQV